MKDSREVYEAIIAEINSAESYVEDADIDEKDFLSAYLNSLLTVKNMMNAIYGEDVKGGTK